MDHFDEADLAALLYLVDPDPADVYEDALAKLLGLEREPWATYPAWRDRRRRFIEEHPQADHFAERAGEIADRQLEASGW